MQHLLVHSATGRFYLRRRRRVKKPKGKKVYSAMKRREARNFYLYTAPWLIGFFVLTLYPIVYSFYLMFTDMNLTGVGKFIGLENLKYAFPPLQMIDSGGSIQWLTIPNVASAPSPPANFFAASATSSRCHRIITDYTPIIMKI